MTNKRFIIIGDEFQEFILQDKLLLPIYDDKKRLSLRDCCDLLNELHEKNQDLKSFNQDLSENLSVCADKRLTQGEHLTELTNENEQLKNRVNELEDDNMKYTLSTDKLEEYTKRFMPTKCINEFRDCKTNRYYWLDNEDNFTGALELLNLLDCENEQLKQRINSRLHYYRELYNHFDKNDGFSYNIVEKVVEDLEDILR